MTRGGVRAGSGRKGRGPARTRRYVSVNLQEHEEAEIMSALLPGETIAAFMRDAAIGEARRRG